MSWTITGLDQPPAGPDGSAAPLRPWARDWSAWLLMLVVQCRIMILLVFHGLIFAAIYLMAYEVRFDNAIPDSAKFAMLTALPFVVGFKLIAFVLTGSHRGWWRYATFADMMTLAEAATLGSVALIMAEYLYGNWIHIPRSVFLMDWTGTLLVLGGTRGATRLFRERYYPMVSTRQFNRVLMVGAADAGATLVRGIHSQPKLGMKVVGLLDPDPKTHGRTLAGVKVLGAPAEVQRIASRYRAETVLIPTPATPSRDVRTLVAACNEASLKVQVLPGIDALLSGQLTVQPRDIDIHDLLCREPVRLDTASVARFLAGRVVLVTGAAGSIGSEICRQVLFVQPRRLILLDHSENGLFAIERELWARAGATELVSCVASITDQFRLRATFTQHAPTVVFHAAAHKHVPMMEANPGEAVKNNVFGTQTLVDEAIHGGVEAFVMISTDKAVNPSSVMGACKRLAEMYVQSLSGITPTRLVTVRFGNVLGSNGSVVPIFKEQIQRGGPVTVTHPEMTRYFMTIPEASQLVLQAGALGQGGEIFVLDMGEPVKVVDLARDMIRLSGLGTDGIEIVFTGLRPGEKLYEELYDPNEEQLATPHPKIFAVKSRQCALGRLRAGLRRLAWLVDGPADELTAALTELVPEYRSSRLGRDAAPAVGPDLHHPDGNGRLGQENQLIVNAPK